MNRDLPPRLLTRQEAQDYLRVSREKLMGLVRAGELAALRVGYEYRFSRDDLADFLARNRVLPEAQDGDKAGD